ncbi:Hypothetical predicted protein, partial [Paramuricea clavata]
RQTRCSKSKRCSKNSSHIGKCDKNRVFHEYWQKSAVYKVKNQQSRLAKDVENVEAKKAEIELAEQQLEGKQDEMKNFLTAAEEKVAVARSNLDKLVSEREQTAEKLSVEEQKIKEISKQRGETKNVLEFIHGGENGALLGAWDFVSAEAPKAMMENLIDDGAPETSQLSMSIGSVTFWNLGERKQVFSLCQSWACNEVNQAATYPSPYANVHKGNMCSMGGSIGQSDVDLWKPYTMTELHSKKSFAEEEIGLSKDAASDNMTAMLETSRFASSDNLSNSNETEGEKLRRLALGKIVHVNVTVWTVAYALPYHAKQLYEKTHILNPNANSVPCLCTVCDKRFL